jgi:hypothetical protein
VAQLLEENFEQVVPHAATRGPRFLGVVQKRCQAEGIGIDLQPTKPDRKSDRVILQAELVIGSWARRGRPLRLEVFADPIGSSLHVGWHLTKEVVGTGILGNTPMMSDINYRLDLKDARPENIRQINGIVSAFQATVFLPVLQQLADSVDRARTQRGQSGFLGA